jgi:hypothetical protein
MPSGKLRLAGARNSIKALPKTPFLVRRLIHNGPDVRVMLDVYRRTE